MTNDADFPEVRLIRPSAVLPEAAAVQIIQALENDSVHNNGLWLASTTAWQRYDRPWAGSGADVDAILIGTISVVYNTPRDREITIYKISITDPGKEQGWSIDSLADEALSYAGYTLANCPRASLLPPPPQDPFRARAGMLDPDAPDEYKTAQESESPFNF